MNNLNDGVGKKIVEALKKQTELDNNVVVENDMAEDTELNLDLSDLGGESEEKLLVASQEEDTPDTLGMSDFFSERIELEPEVQPEFNDFSLPKEEKPAENIEMPSNIMVLKKLVSQLPSGVTRHTGAQIIRQTMEALGISMKSVLTEAQEVQNNLKESAKECQITIQEYKRKITNLEKQTQNYQKQYSALNDLISLFIQTTKA